MTKRTCADIYAQDGELKKEVDLRDEDSRIVSLMVDFMYQLDYDDLLPIANTSTVPADQSSSLALNDTELPPTIADGTVLEAAAHPSAYDESALEATPAPEPEPQPEPEPPIPDTYWVDNAAPSAVNEYDDWAISFNAKKRQKGKKKKKKKTLHLPDLDTDSLMERLTVNAKMYALADKFDIQDLKLLARDKFESATTQDWESMAFVRAAKLVFESTPLSDHGLRDIVIKTIIAHRELINYKETTQLLDSGNGIAWMVLQHHWRED
ncbi:hypothetical protein H2198_006770 [Neophaeococcomyces mojaviensis]|uniref:Uncharacterized protein n=1 Tax=Neophaeococcomyces mojaviensis TaxID=3383035 RepID=A0ACC3A210_9EURO|nr:hypothetical protein H2198_006770 [Knufia sp. JES_112]